MIPAPIPADKQRRPNALRKLLILDTPPEQRFDRIVDFAATQFDTPIAHFDALIIDLDAGGNAIGWISKLRNGNSKCDVAIPIAVLVATCDTAMVERIKQFDVRPDGSAYPAMLHPTV